MTHKIDLVPLDELQPNPANPKNHDEVLLDKSLATFGYVDPIVVDQRTGFMISGHGRKQVLTNMRDEGKEPPTGITVKDGVWLVPIVSGWASKDDTDARAALVALNRTTEQGGWNRENLYDILKELSENNTLDTVGFVETDLANLGKALEATDVFTMDISTAIDEFIGDSGVDERGVEMQYSTMLKVYFQTPDARQEFFNLIGYKNDEKQLTIRYPATFTRKDADEWRG
jgi:hypothetical protein